MDVLGLGDFGSIRKKVLTKLDANKQRSQSSPSHPFARVLKWMKIIKLKMAENLFEKHKKWKLQANLIGKNYEFNRYFYCKLLNESRTFLFYRINYKKLEVV